MVELHDPQNVLLANHTLLRTQLAQPPRYPYRPHTTLAYLKAGARLPADLQASIVARLAPCRDRLKVMWLTDRCGLAAGYEAFESRPVRP